MPIALDVNNGDEQIHVYPTICLRIEHLWYKLHLFPSKLGIWIVAASLGLKCCGARVYFDK